MVLWEFFVEAHHIPFVYVYMIGYWAQNTANNLIIPDHYPDNSKVSHAGIVIKLLKKRPVG
jgi:hypothetical protein